jgi:histidinol-phosphate phosphatase family protein
MGTARAILIDKDGTLVEDVPYNVDPARIRLAPGVIEGLRLLRDAGFKLIVVSNQSGLARGRFTEADLAGAERALRAALRRDGVEPDGFYYCPHHPEGVVRRYAMECTCRKPRPGLVQMAGREHRLALEESWMVGDILDDVEAGHRAGCRAILVDVGNETEWQLSALRTPATIVHDFSEAARYIVARDPGHGLKACRVAGSKGRKGRA